MNARVQPGGVNAFGATNHTHTHEIRDANKAFHNTLMHHLTIVLSLEIIPLLRLTRSRASKRIPLVQARIHRKKSSRYEREAL